MMRGRRRPDRWSRSPQRSQAVFNLQIVTIRPALEGTPPVKLRSAHAPYIQYGYGTELTFVTIDSPPNLLREISVLSFNHLTFTRMV